MPGATYVIDNVIVNADGPDKDNYFTFTMYMKASGDEPEETQVYRRDEAGWQFFHEGYWYPTKSVPMQVRQARVKYGFGPIRSRR